MKTFRLRLPALILTAGLGAGLIGCRSDAAEKSAREVPAATTDVAVTSPGPASIAVPVPAPTAESAPATEPEKAEIAPAEAITATVSTNAPTVRVEPQLPELSPAVREVVDMAQAKVGDSVLLEFVKGSQIPFDLDADDLVYLKDIGLPEDVVTSMLKRNGELREQNLTAAPVPEEAAAVSAQGAEAPQPALAEAAAPPTSVYSDTVTPSAPSEPVVEAAATALPPPTSNYFYSALSPYGSWLYIEPYGWCWQPTAAATVVDWRPYSHSGRWRYTTGGWYWQSYYSWGWAPFHYGNWYMNPACGWVWVPGSTWAPAWVTWRYTPAYCGWAPLPPGCGWNSGVGLTYYGRGVSVGFSFGLSWSSYAFVGWNDCWRPYPHRYSLPRTHSASVYHRSTVINNYYVDNSTKTIINNGVPTRAIPASARREMRRLDLKDVQAGQRAPVRPEQSSLDGTKVAVYRPKVPSDLKGGPAKTADVPYRVPRARGDEPKSSRTGLAPERNPFDAGSLGRTYRTPQRSSPTIADTPSRSSVNVSPSRSRTQPGSAASTPTRGEAYTPTRSTPSTPTRSEPRVTGSPSRTSPGRVQSPSLPSTPQRAVVPNRSVPQTSGRIERSAPGPQFPVNPRVNNPAPSSSSSGLDMRSRPATTRGDIPKPPPSPPVGRNFGAPRSTAPNIAPSRSPGAVPSAPARSFVPSAPPSSRTPSAPPPSFNRSAPSAPPAVSSPPARSPSTSSTPSGGNSSGGRQAPSGSPPTRGYQPR